MSQGPEGGPFSPKKIIEQATQETESAYIKLMDEMEASVPQNGNFFIKVGGKSMPPIGSTPTVITANVDTRALILNEGREKIDNAGVKHSKEYVVATRKGLKILTITPEQLEERAVSGGNFQEDPTNGKEIIDWKNGNASYLRDARDEDSSFIQESLQKSIEEARKTSKTLGGEKRKQTAAQRFSDILRSLTSQGSAVLETSTQSPPPATPSPSTSPTGLPPQPQL